MSRWLAFLGAVSSLLLLTSGHVHLQWIGWAVSSLSCIAWVWFAKQDKDIPRMLMEICYFLAGIWGIYNWV